MNRRDLLAGAAGSAFFVALTTTCALAQTKAESSRAKSIATWRKRISEILARGALPIIDVQATYVRGTTNVGWLVEQMRQLDVAQIVFAAAMAPDSSPALELHRQYPEFIIPASNSGEFPRWWKGPTQFVAGLERDLATGDYYMMGEHEFRHYPSPEQAAEGRKDRDISIDVTGAAGQALFQLAERTGVAFQIHYEIEDQLLPALESMLARYPKANVIWCHLAMIRYPDRSKKYGVDYVNSLINRFPNLHFDLATPLASNVYKPSGARDGTLYEFPSNTVKKEWAALLNKFPERFLAASDYRPAVEKHYPFFIGNQRKLLSQLSPRARQLAAYGNAWRLITGSDWTA
jgi:hypothetical protein